MQAGGWPGGADVRLRIGLHRGRPELTDTGYVGLSVHAAARICFAAHGGQIVMSSAVRGELLDSLPEGVGLRDIGQWRFRGLPEPVEIFQVEADDLQSDFPPLRSAVPPPRSPEPQVASVTSPATMKALAQNWSELTHARRRNVSPSFS